MSQPGGNATPATPTQADLLQVGATRPDEPLGYFLTWEAEKLLVPQPELFTLMQQYGLDGLVTMKPIKTSTAIRRALSEMAADKLIVRRPDSNKRRSVYALIKEGMDPTLVDEPVYDLENKIILWKDDTHVQQIEYKDGRGVPAGDTERRAEPLIQKYQESYTGRDVTSEVFCDLVMRSDGLRLRSGGGMYFVPFRHHDLMERLASFANELAAKYSATCYFHAYRFFPSPVEVMNLASNVTPTIMSAIRTARLELKKMLDERRRSSVKPDTIAKHVAAAGEIRAKALMYRDILKMDVNDLEREITSLIEALENVRAPDTALVAWATSENSDPLLEGDTGPVFTSPQAPDVAPEDEDDRPTAPKLPAVKLSGAREKKSAVAIATPDDDIVW